MQQWDMKSACVLVGVLALAGCGRSSPPVDKPNAPTSVAQAATEKDGCSLLQPKEVEAVLGATLATPPFLSRDGAPTDDGSACEYEDANLHHITIDVEWEGGPTAFKMYGAFQGLVDRSAAKGLVHLADGSELAGEWDEARVVGCCTFVALRGDQMVTIDVGGSKAPIADAAKLADIALKRLDHPFRISGSPNVKAAIEYENAHRPKRQGPCALMTRAEAEALVGPLSQDPQSVDDDQCVYDHAIQGIFAPSYVLKIRWTGGFSEFRQNNATAGNFTTGFTRNMSSGGKQAIESSIVGSDVGANAAWEMAHYSIMGLSAVKKDVLVSIEPQGGKAEDAVKLMEKAMSKF